MINHSGTVYQYIDNNKALIEYCSQLNSSEIIALDTEFVRISTFYPKPALIQVFDGNHYALLDPLGISSWQPFIAILENENITKVLHACDEDIELFYHLFKVFPKSVFDTQVAAALSGLDYCMGYQRLVYQCFQQEIDKSTARSNWLKRPLNEKQIAYAIEDVSHLIALYDLFKPKLVQQNQLASIEEEYQRLISQLADEVFSEAYKKIKPSQKLTGIAIGRLQWLASWREKMMRQFNMPRNHVASNETLLLLAQKSHISLNLLYKASGIPAKILKNQADNIIEALQGILPLADVTYSKKHYQQLKQQLINISSEAQLPEGIVLKKDWLQSLSIVAGNGIEQLPDFIEGWRRPYYQQAFSIFLSHHTR